MRTQKGGYLVFMAVLTPVLVGVGGLAIDLTRLYVLRSEMQNAADAAAVAAAFELDGGPLTRTRAEGAARNLLQYDSKFAEVSELLGANISLEFYCAIQSRYDPDEAEVDVFCTNPYDAEGRSLATNDQEAHYVRVSLVPADGNLAYSLQLSFLPALGALLDGGEDRVALSATAVAGRNFYMCDYPPVMLCNPFEGTTLDFDEEMLAGQQIILKQQGSDTWAPGNFAFLQPDNEPGGGAPEISEFLADETGSGCKAPVITTATGAMTNQTTAGINTRFDIYENPAPYNRADAPENWPPAPNVIDYPRDQSWRAIDARFGNGDWDRETYWNTYHAWQGHVKPTEIYNGVSVFYDSMTRWQAYNWEITSGLLPSKMPLTTTADTTYDGIPDPAHVYTGSYPPAPSAPERRTFHVAVVNCEAHGLSGTQTIPLVSPEGFAQLFLTEHVEKPPTADVYVEYIEWAGDINDNFHTDIQLYE